MYRSVSAVQAAGRCPMLCAKQSVCICRCGPKPQGDNCSREVKQVTCIYLALPAVTLSHLTSALGNTEPRTGSSKHLINYSDCVGSTPGLAGVLTNGVVVAPAMFLISSLLQRLLDACFLVCPETSIASLTACCQIRTLALLFAKPCPGSPSPLKCRYESRSAHLRVLSSTI